MSKSAMGSALIVIGILVVIIGFTADIIGLGRVPGMGMLQWSAVIAGLLAMVIGFVLRSQGGAEPTAPAAPRHEPPKAPSGEGHGGPEGTP